MVPLPTIDSPLHHIEAAKKVAMLPHFAAMVETGSVKLADYEVAEDSPAYSAATILKPFPEIGVHSTEMERFI